MILYYQFLLTALHCYISLSSVFSQRHPAELRRNDDSEAVSVPAQGVLSKTAGKAVPSNWGQGQVKLQGHSSQTLSDDAKRGGEEEAQGADAFGDRAGEHVAETGAGGAPRMPEEVSGITSTGTHSPASLRNYQPSLKSAIQP